LDVLSAARFDETLDEIVQRLVDGMHATQIILFGSHAYGQPDAGSDLDLMVIVPESREPAYRRAQHAYACVGAVSMPKDLLVLTEEEFEGQARVATSLARLVKEEGKVLYERRERARNPQLAAQGS